MRPRGQRYSAPFLWQGMLLILPVVVLAVLGSLFLRQDRVLAEKDAPGTLSILRR
jgi:hypothetical protein